MSDKRTEAVKRAAEVIRATDASGRAPYRLIAQALIDAGWHDGPKLTDVDQAVLDAAEAHERTMTPAGAGPFAYPVCVAVRARRETQP